MQKFTFLLVVLLIAAYLLNVWVKAGRSIKLKAFGVKLEVDDPNYLLT